MNLSENVTAVLELDWKNMLGPISVNLCCLDFGQVVVQNYSTPLYLSWQNVLLFMDCFSSNFAVFLNCLNVQIMLSTDPSYENRTIVSTLKVQTRTVRRAQGGENKVSGYGYGLWCGFK